jgi:hypothetical protein
VVPNLTAGDPYVATFRDPATGATAPPIPFRAVRNNSTINTALLYTPPSIGKVTLQFNYAVAGTTTACLVTALGPPPAGLAAAPAPFGGALTVAGSPYSYQVSQVTANGESTASGLVAATIPGIPGITPDTGSVVLFWNPSNLATSYKVYGRTAGSMGLLATVTTPTYTDTGAATPGPAPIVTPAVASCPPGVVPTPPGPPAIPDLPEVRLTGTVGFSLSSSGQPVAPIQKTFTAAANKLNGFGDGTWSFSSSDIIQLLPSANVTFAVTDPAGAFQPFAVTVSPSGTGAFGPQLFTLTPTQNTITNAMMVGSISAISPSTGLAVPVAVALSPSIQGASVVDSGGQLSWNTTSTSVQVQPGLYTLTFSASGFETQTASYAVPFFPGVPFPNIGTITLSPLKTLEVALSNFTPQQNLPLPTVYLYKTTSGRVLVDQQTLSSAGNAAFQNLSVKDTFEVDIRGPGFATSVTTGVNVGSGMPQTTLTAEGFITGTLSGQINTTTFPLAGQTVTATLQSPPTGGSCPADTDNPPSVSTAGDGTFTIVGDPSTGDGGLCNLATYKVTASIPGYALATMTVPISSTGANPPVPPGGLAAAPAGTGGTLTVAASPYSYQVSQVTANGESTASGLVATTIPGTTTTTGSVVLTWTPSNLATSYKVYGRTAGSIGLLATVTTPTYTDTGAATPGVAPATNAFVAVANKIVQKVVVMDQDRNAIKPGPGGQGLGITDFSPIGSPVTFTLEADKVTYDLTIDPTPYTFVFTATGYTTQSLGPIPYSPNESPPLLNVKLLLDKNTITGTVTTPGPGGTPVGLPGVTVSLFPDTVGAAALKSGTCGPPPDGCTDASGVYTLNNEDALPYIPDGTYILGAVLKGYTYGQQPQVFQTTLPRTIVNLSLVPNRVNLSVAMSSTLGSSSDLSGATVTLTPKTPAGGIQPCGTGSQLVPGFGTPLTVGVASSTATFNQVIPDVYTLSASDADHPAQTGTTLTVCPDGSTTPSSPSFQFKEGEVSGTVGIPAGTNPPLAASSVTVDLFTGGSASGTSRRLSVSCSPASSSCTTGAFSAFVALGSAYTVQASMTGLTLDPTDITTTSPLTPANLSATLSLTLLAATREVDVTVTSGGTTPINLAAGTVTLTLASGAPYSGSAGTPTGTIVSGVAKITGVAPSATAYDAAVASPDGSITATAKGSVLVQIGTGPVPTTVTAAFGQISGTVTLSPAPTASTTVTATVCAGAAGCTKPLTTPQTINVDTSGSASYTLQLPPSSGTGDVVSFSASGYASQSTTALVVTDGATTPASITLTAPPPSTTTTT